jgi:hypothetical protein
MTTPTLATANPGIGVAQTVERILALAATWLVWDGRPILSEGGDRIYTPNKAIRRHADHFLDHLAEIEALLAGQPTEPDRWRASLVTVDSDWARFTEVDLNEASQRFTRLGQIYVQRYTAAGPDQWDTPRGENRTLREIAEHVASSWYAEQVGDLGASAMP